MAVNGKFPKKTVGSRPDSLPVSVTASLSNTQANTDGPLSISGDARFPTGLPKSRRKG